MTDEDKTIDQQTYDAVESDIKDFDFDRTAMLMGIIEKVTTVAPKNTAIMGLAQAELERMNVQAQEVARKRAERHQALEHQRLAEEKRQRMAQAIADDAAAKAEQDKVDEADRVPRSIPRNQSTQPANGLRRS